ncbi:hypothetical protein NQ317_011375 [Molorchus minor]|uniref:Uncharacterized protein n=1 Tax=Molorchus minor TaxID=1323400 RepID=A0ABQ9JCL7_9CUCU|nr:hypothetical protein NQ317_011375 [Molorchus minor]
MDFQNDATGSKIAAPPSKKLKLVAEGHHVFLNLQTLKFYCLPDNYEIIDSSLDDIKYVLNPTFTEEHIKDLDKSTKLSRAIDGSLYTPGIVGLNNIKANDYCNVVLQRFGELMRKQWNPRNFKAHVSPHEMLQAVVLWSKKQFQFTQQEKKSLLATAEYQEVATESPFLYLTCDLPPPPLFIDEFRENIIPQVNLYQLLTKFNGQTEKEYKTYKENFMKRFEITRLPPYLILYIKRFTKNTFLHREKSYNCEFSSEKRGLC